jgi:hypothetical protein
VCWDCSDWGGGLMFYFRTYEFWSWILDIPKLRARQCS